MQDLNYKEDPGQWQDGTTFTLIGDCLGGMITDEGHRIKIAKTYARIAALPLIGQSIPLHEVSTHVNKGNISTI